MKRRIMMIDDEEAILQSLLSKRLVCADAFLSQASTTDRAMADELRSAPRLTFGGDELAHRRSGTWLKKASAPTEFRRPGHF